MSDSKKITIEFPFFYVLGLIFITLKLTGYITWSWWWVLAPFWAPVALMLIAGIVVLISAACLGLFKGK